jgi:hypothetical protein
MRTLVFFNQEDKEYERTNTNNRSIHNILNGQIRS